jgi:acetyl-CoA carboxylase carboxyl transferase subunit beta
MGWFTKSPKKTREKKEQLWVVCPSCKDHVFKEEWQKTLKVCTKCAYHERLNYQERIDLVADAGTFREINADVTFSDPLKFADSSGTYKQKAEEAKNKTGMKEAVITGTAEVGGVSICMAIMDFRFLGGSLGSGAGEKILLAAEHALENRLPYIVFSASGGARMHEGIVSLMQMAKTCAAIARLNKGRIPYISVLTDPTYGGVSASFATVGDLNIAEPGALIGFAGRRVIEQTIKQKLPDDFQTAEYLLKHGFIDSIVKRVEMKDYLHRILLYWQAK